MQLDNLYPTDVTDMTTGISFSAFTESIEGIEDSMADAYLMGYLPPEMVAPSFRPVILSGGGDSVSAVYDNSQNYGWGYIFRQGSADGTGGVNYIDQNGVYRRLYNVDPDYRFINAAEMSKYCTDDTVTIYIAALAINKDYWDSAKMATTQMIGGYDVQLIVNITQMYTFEQWRDIIKNDTIFYNGTAQGHTITLRPSDFGDANDPNQLHVKFFESGNYIIRADIYNYIIGATHYMNLNAGYSNYIITPFVQAKISAAGLPDTVANVIPGTNLQHYFWMRYTNGGLSFERGQTTGQNNYDYIPDYNVTFGGFNNGTVSVSDIDFSTASNNARLGFARNWYFNYDNGVFRIVPTFTPLDIYHHMLLFHKHTNAPSADYSSADTVTVFTNDDSPTTDTVSGNLSEIAARLRPWQFPNVDIKSNTFTPEDIPDPSPEPGYDEESGDTIDFIMRSFSGASNFITNYAMTRQQVGIFGNRLWTSWVDSLGNPTEMIKNIRIFYTGGDTGSIDIGSVMPFIVSMKIFPFDLSNFIGYETNGIKIGTGHYPINVPGCWYLPRSSVYVSCGTITIPRIFNDFRDYENMNIMCYVPYCGTVELNPGDVIGRTLSCTYGVDLQSGGCTAYIIVDNNYPVATISGQMGSSVPLTATNSGQLMSQRLSDISGASALIGNTTMQVQRESERPHPKQANMDSAIVGAVLQAADSVPQRFRRSAISCPTMSAGNGLDAFAQPPTPYIQMRYGIYDLPANYKHSIGRISTKSNKLSEYKDTGFIACSNVDTSPLTCHNDEKAAIKAALESGVYI